MRDDAAFTEFAEAARSRLRSTAYLLCCDGEQASDQDVVESVAVRAVLMSALAHLPSRQRACVVLRYIDTLTVVDTATALGCSEGTVKSQTSRALTSLRSTFALAERRAGHRRRATMVNDLKVLLQESVAATPHDHLDLGDVVTAGRRRVRRRRVAGAGIALASVALVGAGSFALVDQSPPDFAAAGVPRPEGPTLRLIDATPAVEGTDYRVLASSTNENLDADNGQCFDGVTDGGLILFRDGPRMDQPTPRFALLDPGIGEKDWLPDPDVGQAQTWPVDLGEDRLVLVSGGGGRGTEIEAYVFDRGSR